MVAILAWPRTPAMVGSGTLVSGASDPGAPARQHAYLSTLRTLPEVEVHFGSFLAKIVWAAHEPVGRW